MKLNVINEYNSLKSVLLAPVDSEYLKQQEELIKIFDKYQVKVIKTSYCDGAKYQMFVRDPFIVIGDKLILCNMKEEFRKQELKTLEQILKKIDSSNIIKAEDDTFIEGGDVIIHNDIIFVGQNGGRTNKKGLDFLKKYFSNKYKIVSLNMINPDPYIPWIHLDCLFNPISIDTAILYEEGFDEKSLKILNKLFPNKLLVTKNEQEELATNLISLGNKTIIMQERHGRLIILLKELGFNVEEVHNYNTIKEIGFNRCLTCPLERK